MFGDVAEYLPILIRVGAVIIIAASLFDYFKRKWAKSIVEAVNSAGAVSKETAVSTSELEKIKPGIRKLIGLLLKYEYSPLRRKVKCVSPEAVEENDKKSKNKPAKLTENEKWYIDPPKPLMDDEEDKSAEEDQHTPSTPAILREGAEVNPVKLVIGLVLTVIFCEAIIYFLPQIMSFFENISNFGAE